MTLNRSFMIENPSNVAEFNNHAKKSGAKSLYSDVTDSLPVQIPD